MNNKLPVFLNTPSTKEILYEIISLIPDDAEVYLFGGTIRNAMYYLDHNEEMTQRDFDCIVIGNGEVFVENLLSTGFVFGKKNTDKSKVLKKPRIKNPEHPYNDWLYLDCKFYSKDETIKNVLNRITDFTISGVALNIKDIFLTNWQDKVISILHALEDIRIKNLTIVNPYPNSFHKIIRMVSRGFHKPSKSDIGICVEKLKEIADEKFELNTDKTIKYVGSEHEVVKITKELGIGFDIFNLTQIRNSTPSHYE